MFNLLETRSLFFIENFNTGFPSSIADVVIHLSQWQFWFWYWFCIFWILFIIIVYKTYLYNNSKYSTQINTSLRPHGKWGDFLAALLPLTWCSGILINSNFILRTLEWQHENTLFTLRIHGRQWYWIFKYDIRTLSDIYDVKLKTGYKFLYLTNNNNKKTFKNLFFFYNNLLIKVNKVYFYNICEKSWKTLFFDFYINEILYKNTINNFNIHLDTDVDDFYIGYKRFRKYKRKRNLNIFNFLETKNINNDDNKDFKKFNFIEKNWDVKWSKRKNNFKLPMSIYTNNLNINTINNNKILNNRDHPLNYNNLTLNYGFWMDRCTRTKSPDYIRIHLFSDILYIIFKNIKKKININSFSINLSTVKSSSNIISEKIMDNRLFYILKQRKPKKKCELSYNIDKIRKDFYKKFQFNRSFKDYWEINKYNKYNKYNNNNNSRYLLERYLYKKKKIKKTEIFSFSLSKRLLKVRKTLLLPVATNIALVTSSYDVAHSLFIPAMGLKFDCIPGRSTHHTLNILHRGIYYAQCAEVCGRYHHHMPAKISVVFFEQFINWWKIRSLNIFIKLNKTYVLKNYYILNYYFTKIFIN